MIDTILCSEYILYDDVIMLTKDKKMLKICPHVCRGEECANFNTNCCRQSFVLALHKCPTAKTHLRFHS